MDPTYNMMGAGLFNNPSSRYRHYWTNAFGKYHRDPDQACIGGYPAPVLPAGCEDIDLYNCDLYKSEGECTSNPNVRSHCKDTCGIGECAGHGSASQPVPNSHAQPESAPAPRHSTSNCADTVDYCSSYGKDECHNDESVKHHCKRSCGFCGAESATRPAQPSPRHAPHPAPQPPTSQCADGVDYCSSYGKDECHSDESVRYYCKKSCGLCSTAPASRRSRRWR